MPERRKLTPPQIARLYCVSPSKVVAWTRNGELIFPSAALYFPR